MLATESPLKMTENVFYHHFTVNAFFVFKIFKFLSWLLGHVEKRLDLKDKVIFKLYDVTVSERNNARIYNSSSCPHITHFLAVAAKKQKNFE